MITIKRFQNIIWFALAIGITIMPASVMAHGIDFSQYKDDDRPDKAGVLVIALVPPDAATAAKQGLMAQRIKTVFPNLAMQWAYFNLGSGQADTFKTTGNRESPKQMLDRMEEDEITHVAILPLAVIPGESYTRLVWMVETLRKMPTRFRKITLAKPFFGAPEDIRQTCQTILDLLPDHTDKGDAVVLFFEEQSRLGDYIYPGIQYYFWQLDASVFVGTAGTTPGMPDVLQSLNASGASDIFLVPFLPYQTPALKAWHTALEDSSFRVRTIKTPLIGNERALDVMITRLADALDGLGLRIR